MSNIETLITKSSLLFFIAIFLLPAGVMAQDKFSRYGFGTEGLSLSKKPITSVDSSESAFQIEFEYQDEAASFASPDLSNKLNHTSNVYQTRIGYQLKHLTPEASFNYSPDSFGYGEYYNYGLGFAVPVKDLFSVETRYGWNKFNKQMKHGGMDDYQDWSISISTMYRGMKLKVDYIDMNASETQECGRLFPCEGKTVFSIIKNF